jgi:xanthine dehydrogenase iron-sulfur cluster and FAD-binding subunit A
MSPNQRGIFLKHALRRAQAISIINVSILLTMQDDVVNNSAITLGSVAPTIIHAEEAEKYLIGKKLTKETNEAAAKLTMQASRPISDLRSSKDYREEIVGVITRRGLEALAQNKEFEGLPSKPPLLWGKNHKGKKGVPQRNFVSNGDPIETVINGRKYIFKNGQDKTLLRLIREDALLTGTKEGCAEGECGACTVYLDGMAVMSCMVPAPRADGAEIVTIEGLAVGNKLHPVQEAFIQEGAVQCGYCTPGFIMSAAKLLEENPNPDTDQIKQSITGNLCRCTGYYKIIQAIEKAATI